uniref:preprotein-translocase subunit a n=1 Tax=Cryptomonas gyropyrenoidosa TaxID=233257 RepID=UPI0027A59B59|nr:preprotein-translocase subunit a [Cryptomonas gyropyrenoidosa]WFQ82928.1 preprotein-translocase subunit a [Cryptomonas gyropyrenoidosa]
MFQTLFGDSDEKKVRFYSKTVNKINKLEEEVKPLTDIELQSRTSVFIEKIASGDLVETFLEEAFAVVREASRRVLGLRHFDVQIIGGLILHEGKIAEMKTGEGKTLVAILPSYVNALTGQGVHIVTVNDYLASRDAEYVGQVHKFLGLSVGLIQNSMSSSDRKLNYIKDITYLTNSELGFDYLRDNMAMDLIEIVQRPFYFSILDEVDSILIDEARTPLIISGSGEVSHSKYTKSDMLAQLLVSGIHYELDEKAKNISLSEEGIIYSEHYLNVKDIYDVKDPWAPYIFNSIKAKEFFLKDVHYIVKDKEVLIVDEFTGRIMNGRRWSDGLHQAIEAKENIEIKNETQTLASITYQNFFLLYPKLSGMTGTAKTEETELDRIYNLEVICVPTNKKMIRRDFSDLVYKNQYIKWKSVADECCDMYNLGRPVLVGTTSVEKSELLSSLLKEYSIPHNLLNAKPENLEREAEIIAQAGRYRSVTIATNMAGRGTDILLGGNIAYKARVTLKAFLDSIFNNCKVKDLEDPELRNVYELLKFKLFNKKKMSLTIDSYLSDACERTFVDDRYTLILRAFYKILLEKFNYEVLEERNKVISLGGLHVIGTERHDSRRIDNQLRGRSGRQGDPGSSRFFLSLEDNLLRVFGGDKIKDFMNSLQIDDNVPIESLLLNKSLESAQKKVESYYYDTRKQLFEYDEVLNYQRQAIYSERRKILESTNLRDWIIQYAEITVADYINYYLENKQVNKEKIDTFLNKIENLLGIPYKIDRDFLESCSILEIQDYLFKQIKILYSLKENQIELVESGLMRELERSFLLQKIDSSWKNHLQQINLLRENIGWRGYGQKDPLIEYKNEAYTLFVSMTANVRHSVVYLILGSQPLLKQ